MCILQRQVEALHKVMLGFTHMLCRERVDGSLRGIMLMGIECKEKYTMVHPAWVEDVGRKKWGCGWEAWVEGVGGGCWWRVWVGRCGWGGVGEDVYIYGCKGLDINLPPSSPSFSPSSPSSSSLSRVPSPSLLPFPFLDLILSFLLPLTSSPLSTLLPFPAPFLSYHLISLPSSPPPFSSPSPQRLPFWSTNYTIVCWTRSTPKAWLPCLNWKSRSSWATPS